MDMVVSVKGSKSLDIFQTEYMLLILSFSMAMA
jgi:hypothetical protein